MPLIFIIILTFQFLPGSPPADPPNGISFRFKQRDMMLIHPMRKGKSSFLPRGNYSDKKLDTLSNWFDTKRKYVEIVRQDHPSFPSIGLALGFEFDEKSGEFPYTPEYAVLQFKDFRWGGVEFSPDDTVNYTGVSNAVSDDLSIEVLDFQNDTITGRFSGVLLNGAGAMTAIERGRFKVRIYRK